MRGGERWSVFFAPKGERAGGVHFPFGERTARRLRTIAQDGRLASGHMCPRLPPSWGTLYKLATLDDEAWPSVKPHISPDLTREDISRIIRAQKADKLREELDDAEALEAKRAEGVIARLRLSGWAHPPARAVPPARWEALRAAHAGCEGCGPGAASRHASNPLAPALKPDPRPPSRGRRSRQRLALIVAQRRAMAAPPQLPKDDGVTVPVLSIEWTRLVRVLHHPKELELRDRANRVLVNQGVATRPTEHKVSHTVATVAGSGSASTRR